MKIQPKLQVTGYRGVWGDTLTPEIVKSYVHAFALFTKEDAQKENPTILIGRDGRESGVEIKNIIIDELENLGITVIDGDILPTPTILLAVKKHGYDGAVIITASHNPREYNGVKFVTNKALLTNEAQVEVMKKFIEEKPENTASKNPGQKITAIPDFPKEHADFILEHIDVAAIRARKFKATVDMINASACVMDQYLFEQLGVELVPLNNIPNGEFAHKPEPTIENLTDLGRLVKESGADIGFAHDPDADRMVFVNEKGEVIAEDYTLAFGVENILSKNPGKNVVINLSTSSMISDIVEKYGGKCFRTKVGESNVLEEIGKQNAIIGGEGTSGVIYPTINTSRDGFVSLSLALELLAQRNQTVSECAATLPKYYMKRDKWPVTADLNDMYLKLKNHFKDAKTNELDGLRLDFPNGSWLHIRPSITEPIVRLFGEAKTEEGVNSLFEEAKLTLSPQ